MKNKEIYQKTEKLEKGRTEEKEEILKLEQEILKLEKELSKEKKEKETKIEKYDIKEKIKETVGQKIKESEKTEQEVTAISSISSSLTDDEVDEIVENLINMTFKQGVESVIRKVESLNNPYILDEFHDRLIEKLRELKKKEKKRKGLINEI